jgi:prepilin-type N-terminal cleavage/methylation domain-containing protein
MARGFSLIELAVVLLIAGALALVGVPHLRRALDRIATDRAAVEITTALAVGRNGAVSYGTRARVRIAADTLRIDRMEAGEWVPWWRRAGPDDFGVRLEVSNPEVIFGPTGLGWGASNTAVVLRRGSQVETITTSRLGRVKRW